MGFYSVVIFASGALFSCFVTTRSQLATVTADLSTVKYEDEKWDNNATMRLLGALSDAAADSEEERAPLGINAAELVADFTAKEIHPVEWNDFKVFKGLGYPRFSDKDLQPQSDTKNELVRYLVEAFHRTLWDNEYHTKNVNAKELFEILSKHFGHDLLAYVLAKMEALHPGIRNHASEYHHQYLEWLIEQGRTPSNVLELWNKEGIPLSTVVKNLYEFIELYNKEEGTMTTAFDVLKTVFKNQKEMVHELTSLKREGEEIGRQLHTEMVETLFDEKKTFDEVFELTRPESDKEKWSFDTLFEFAKMSRWDWDFFTHTLILKFGGYDKLAPVLAEAKSYDKIAADLQQQIVSYFIDLKYNFEVAVQALDLLEGEVTQTKTDTLKLFARAYMVKYGVKFDWLKEWDEIRAAHSNEVSEGLS